MDNLEEIKNSRGTLVHDQIIKMIMDGEIPFGEKINKNFIADKLNVSMTPVNEAINRLTVMGVIEHQKNYGYFLREITWQDIEDSYYTRAATDGMAVYVYTKFHYNPEDEFLHLFDCFDQGVKPEQASEYLKLDLQFHTDLLKKCGNSMLYQISNNYHYLLHSYHHGMSREPAESLLEHKIILRAIHERMPDYARELMTQHHIMAAKYIGKIKNNEVIEKFWGKED
jgi:DNA-binding GntR family transcriptional regulator